MISLTPLQYAAGTVLLINQCKVLRRALHVMLSLLSTIGWSFKWFFLCFFFSSKLTNFVYKCRDVMWGDAGEAFYTILLVTLFLIWSKVTNENFTWLWFAELASQPMQRSLFTVNLNNLSVKCFSIRMQNVCTPCNKTVTRNFSSVWFCMLVIYDLSFEDAQMFAKIPVCQTILKL